jgi:hypothetical protein
MGTPTLQTLQDPILLTCCLCFRGGFPNPLPSRALTSMGTSAPCCTMASHVYITPSTAPASGLERVHLRRRIFPNLEIYRGNTFIVCEGGGGVAHMLRSTIAQFLATACREGCGRFNTRQRRKIASRNGRDFGWEMAQAAVSRRPPTLSRSVARTHLYTTREFGVCPSFKGHFPSRRANLTLRFATFASLYGGVS